jgi:hypothetical protein
MMIDTAYPMTPIQAKEYRVEVSEDGATSVGAAPDD